MKKITFVLLLTMVLILGSIVGSCRGNITPADRVIQSMKLDESRKKVDVVMSLDFNVSKTDLQTILDSNYIDMSDAKIKQLTNIINKLEFGVRTQSDLSDSKKPFELFGEIYANYNKTRLLDLNMLMDIENIGFSAPILYDGVFRLDFNELFKDLNMNIDLTKIDLVAYRDILYDFNDEKYKKYYDSVVLKNEILLNYLENSLVKTKNIFIECLGRKTAVNEYELKTSIEEIIKTLNEYSNDLKANTDYKEYIISRVNKLIDHFIESEDYLIFGLNIEEVEDFRTNYIETQNVAFEEANIQQFSQEEIDQVASTFRELEEMGISFKATIALDKKNRLKRVAIKLNYNESSMEITYDIVAVGKSVKIKKMSENVIDIKDILENSESYGGKLKSIALGAIDALKNGNSFKEIYKDLKEFNDLGLDSWLFKLDMAGYTLDSIPDEEFVSTITGQSDLGNKY